MEKDDPSNLFNENELTYDLIEQNKKIIKKNIFKFNPKPFFVGSPQGEAATEPEISFIRNDKNEVKEITVKCVCGRSIHIECN